MHFCVLLRDLSISPVKILLEENRDLDQTDRDDLEEGALETDALSKFTERALNFTPPHENVDVYIGYWIDQGRFEFPFEFFVLITKKGWKVFFDIND